MFIWLNWAQKSYFLQFKPTILWSAHIFYLFEDCCASAHSTEKTLPSDSPYSSWLWVHWLLCSYFPSSLSSHLFTSKHVVPDQNIMYHPLLVHTSKEELPIFFCLSCDLPLYIYFRIKFTFLCDIIWFSFVIPPNLQIQLWLLLQNPRFFIVFKLFFCFYFSTNSKIILTVIHSSKVLAAPSSLIPLCKFSK